MGRTSNKITLEQVININRQMINSFGGIFFEADQNLLKRGNLEYALEEIDATLFGEELHPDLFEKAATLTFKIITGHVFHDGNKRTGLATGQILIMMNGYDLPLHMIVDEAVSVAEQVATKQITVVDLARWFKKHSAKINPY